MATLGMMCERVGMLKITANFFIEGLYIPIPIKHDGNGQMCA
jgi:hypothetical protein